MKHIECFYMVYSPQGTTPKHEHNSEVQAIAEAERLARENPRKEFYVLQAIAGRAVDGMQRVALRELPF